MYEICFLDRSTFAAHLALRKPTVAHRWVEYDITQSAEETRNRLQKAQIVVVNKVALKQEVLAQLPQLQLIALTATGFNNIDLNVCIERQITVCNVRAYATTTLAEHTLALLFALSRNITAYHQSVMRGTWSQGQQFCYFDYPIEDISGKNLCIVGNGSLGQAVGKKAAALGMKIIIAEHKQATKVRTGYTPFYEALAQADVVTMHCPLNEHTNKLLGTKEFAAMRSSALLINTARGAVIDEQALKEALDTNQIRGAALDVLASEPPSTTHPLLQQPRPNLIITPHIAWASDHGQLAAWEQTMENIEAWCANKPIRTLCFAS